MEGRDLKQLDNETGGHRFQRVPPTERSGRVHTSTVTVAVMDAACVVTRVRGLDEFELEWFSGTGNGGQHRNKHMNSCRLVHPPTGLVQTAVSRSRTANLDSALAEMNRRLDELELKRKMSEENSARRSQLGTGMRGDKRRTYRYREDIVSDDVTGKQARLSKVMRGQFELLW